MGMERSEILKLYDDFSSEFDIDGEDKIWEDKSKKFRDFWKDKILNDNVKELNQSEVDEIIRILDKNGKGNKPGDHAVAKCMIRQDIWRKMFNDIKKDPKIKDLLNKILNATDDEALIKWLDDLNNANSGKRNGLTGNKGNAINAMLFAYTPTKYISAVSLDDRESIIKTFNFENGPDFDNDSWGRKIVASNRAIIEGFRNLGINASPRVISQFLYRNLKPYWKPDIEDAKLSSLNTTMDEISEQASKIDTTTFVMEKHLEDFLIANWENTDFGKKYELINDEKGELVSQQYHTDVGSIDILVKDKENGGYTVIELKRDKTSDSAVGQLLRYMGWVRENLANGKPVHGIIIAAESDKRLAYALKMIDGAELYLYQIDFKLTRANKL